MWESEDCGGGQGQERKREESKLPLSLSEDLQPRINQTPPTSINLTSFHSPTQPPSFSQLHFFTPYILLLPLLNWCTMYRSSFAPPPAHSPPLHHPVPQHVSTVPMMRSPPPPAPQQPPSAGYGGNPYQPSPAQSGSGTYAPGFGGFMTDPTAQMGFQVGKSAMAAGQEYMEQNVRSPVFFLPFGLWLIRETTV